MVSLPNMAAFVSGRRPLKPRFLFQKIEIGFSVRFTLRFSQSHLQVVKSVLLVLSVASRVETIVSACSSVNNPDFRAASGAVASDI